LGRRALTLDLLPRTHGVTYRDIRAPGEPPDSALPADDRRQDMPWPPGCAFRVQTGPKPVGRAVELKLEFTPDTIAPKNARVFVNGVECHPRILPPGAAPGSAGRVCVYALPDEILQDEAQVVEVQPRGSEHFTIVRVEISIAAKTVQ